MLPIQLGTVGWMKDGQMVQSWKDQNPCLGLLYVEIAK